MKSMRYYINLIEKTSNIKFKYFNGDELNNFLYHDYPKSNKNIDKNIKYFYPQYAYEEKYLTYLDNNKLIACVGLQEDPYNKEERILWIKFISVDPKYRNKGLATKLIKNIFEYGRENNFKLLFSSYSEEGELYIKHKINQIKLNYPDVVCLKS